MKVRHVGLIRPIGRWIVQTAARRLKGLQDSGYPYLMMSVNLSPVQLEQSQFADDLIEIVDSEGLSPRSIVFELTETAIIKRLDHVIQFLESTDCRRMMRKVNMAEIDTRDLGQGASLADILNAPPSA